MKTKLSKIAQDLEQGTITEDKAQTLLLGLLSVTPRFSPYQTITDGVYEAKVIGESEIECLTHVKYLHNDCFGKVNTLEWHPK
jgi:hypothetical protein